MASGEKTGEGVIVRGLSLEKVKEALGTLAAEGVTIEEIENKPEAGSGELGLAGYQDVEDFAREHDDYKQRLYTASKFWNILSRSCDEQGVLKMGGKKVQLFMPPETMLRTRIASSSGSFSFKAEGHKLCMDNLAGFVESGLLVSLEGSSKKNQRFGKAFIGWWRERKDAEAGKDSS